MTLNGKSWVYFVPWDPWVFISNQIESLVIIAVRSHELEITTTQTNREEEATGLVLTTHTVI